jgi:hypothetical protein
VETLTRPPQTPVRPRSIAEAPRRWPFWLALALAVAVVAGLFVGYRYLRSYQPLTTGTGVYNVQPAHAVVASFDAYGWTDVGFTQSYVRWDVGRTIQMQFPLWNEGRLPVTIVGPTGSQMDPRSNIQVKLAGTGPIDGPNSGRMTDRFAPFTLRPGEGIQLFVDVKMVRPIDRASGGVVSTVQLDYEAARMTHHITLFMNQSLYLCGGPCPP